MIDDVTETQQDLHPTINHQAGIYTAGELLTKREEGEGGLGKKKKAFQSIILLLNVAFTCMLMNVHL